MPRESDQKQQSFPPRRVPTPNLFNMDNIKLLHNIYQQHWPSLHHRLNRKKFMCLERKWRFFEEEREWVGLVCLFFNYQSEFFPQNTMQTESWTICSEQCHKYDEGYMQQRYVITKSFRNKAQTRLLSIKSKIRMKCSHQCPKFHYPIATSHYSFFQFNFFF